MNITRRLKQILIVCAIFYGWHIPFDSTLSAAQISVANVQVIGSDPAVLKFNRSSTLETLGIVPGTMNIATSNTAHWPAVGDGVDPNDRDGQAGTLWIFLKINGQWMATGAERLRKYQLNGLKPEADPASGGLATLVGEGWLYDVNRWREMTGYNPKPGEHVGFMVAAGSTRSDNNTPVKERTNIIEVEWPDARGANPMRVVWNEANAGGGQSGDAKSRMVAELKRQRAKYGTLDRVSAGKLLNDAAYNLRNEGWVLLGKKSGNNCDQPKTGALVSCDFMVHGPSQRGWDVLIAWDAPGGGGITDMGGEGEDLSGVIADGSRSIVDPVNSGDGPVDPPVDPPIDPTLAARVAAVEAANTALAAQVNDLRSQLDAARGEAAAQRDALNNFNAQLENANRVIQELQARPAPPTGCRATVNLGFARIPVSCSLIQ